MIEKTAIVIPIHNALNYLSAMLKMVDEFYPDRKLVLVDDGSDASTKSFLSEYVKHENTELLTRGHRGWFTRSVNTGLRHVLSKNGDRPDWIILLNSDCTFTTGGFEELFDVWNLVEAEGKKVGMVGADGQKLHCPRWVEKREPDFVTGHCILFKVSVLIEQSLLFPWKNGQVHGFGADDLVHINSDRALSNEFNRRGFATIVSHHTNVGHYGGQSWGFKLWDIPRAHQVGEE